MKRSMLALAACSAASLAAAQSSVQIFGGMDVGYTHAQGSLTSKNQMTSGNNYTSRIGFKGREDLGSGLYAGFYLEAQLNGDDGRGVATNTNNQASGQGTAPAGTQGIVFHRGSYVNLGGEWGEVRLGRDYTAHYRNRTDFDPFTNVGIGWSQAQASSIGGVTNVRASNEISYWTPGSLGGFYGVVNYYLGENNSGTPTSDDGKGASFRVGYKAGPLNVALASGTTKYATTATNGDTRSTNIGASYEFGAVTAMGGYYRDRVAQTIALNGKGWLLGGTAAVGVGQIRFSVSRYEVDSAGNPATRKVAIGYVHNLSKRSALYATYARVSNSGGASYSLANSTTGANGSSSGYDIGIRHIF